LPHPPFLGEWPRPPLVRSLAFSPAGA
jgi:hypothetical protein